MANKNLSAAKKAKNDEFYTLLEDIENELKHYKKHFENKVVFANCDDPYESSFFKFFVLKFNDFKLKKLISTSYSGSPIANKHLKLDKNGERLKTAWKVEIDSIPTAKDGSFDLKDEEFKEFIKEHSTKLEGDGSFQSAESIEMLKSADIVCTNPPFSKFREFVKQLMDYKKKFLIIGSMNAITYKEIFPLIKENKLWLGTGFNLSMVFSSPYENTLEDNKKFVQQKGYDPKTHIKVPAVCWFTNLSHSKRNEKLFLVKKYKGNESNYPKYDNYDAIEVSKVKDIPSDYDGVMGVPITYLGSYNPKQFKIIGEMANTKVDDYNFGYPFVDKKRKYARVLIQKLTKEEIEAIEKAEKEGK